MDAVEKGRAARTVTLLKGSAKKLREHITPQRGRLLMMFLFAGLSLFLWLAGIAGALIYFELGLCAGMNLAFYLAGRFDATRAENFRTMEASAEEWKKLAFQGKALLEPLNAENRALHRVLRDVGYDVTIENDEKAKECRVIVEPLGRSKAQPKPTLH